MFFSNADVKKSAREFFGELFQTGARRHCGSYRDNFIVTRRAVNHGLRKNFRVTRWSRLLENLPRRFIELADAVKFIGRSFGGRVAFALRRVDVNQYGRINHTDARKNILQPGDVVPVDWTNVSKAQSLEHCAGENRGSHSRANGVSRQQNLFADVAEGNIFHEVLEFPLGTMILRLEPNF